MLKVDTIWAFIATDVQHNEECILTLNLIGNFFPAVTTKESLLDKMRPLVDVKVKQGLKVKLVKFTNMEVIEEIT